MSIVEKLQDRMEQRESLSNDQYWLNMASLVILTWVVFLYVIQPDFLGVQAPRYVLWILLMVAGYSLVLYNQTEVLRRKIEELE